MFSKPFAKVVMMGSSNVGKTALINKWTVGNMGLTSPTLGTGAKIISIEDENGVETSLSLWDTAGQDQYITTTSIYCRGSDAAVIVFDVTDRTSFEAIPRWIEILHRYEHIPYVICANKVDRNEHPQVSPAECEKLKAELKTNIYYTSAYTGYNVEEAFSSAACIALQNMRLKMSRLTPKRVDIHAPNSRETERVLCC